MGLAAIIVIITAVVIVRTWLGQASDVTRADGRMWLSSEEGKVPALDPAPVEGTTMQKQEFGAVLGN